MPNLQPQAALEQAVVNAVLGSSLGYASSQCKRMFNGEPPPSCGDVFLSVWWDGSRGSESQRSNLNETFGVYLTLTLRFVQPFDRWLVHRDDMEARMNALRALICQDSWSYTIINAANALAGFRKSGQASIALPVGWCESLVFAGFDAIEDKGPDWFHAQIDSTRMRDCGIAQRAKFVKARRIQAILTAT